MAKKTDVIEVRGTIEELLPGAQFRVRLQNDILVMAHIAGKLRMNKIRLGVGDEVTVEMTPYDLKRGRITYRF